MRILADLPLVLGPCQGCGALQSIIDAKGRRRLVEYRHTILVNDNVFFARTREAARQFGKLMRGKVL